MRALLPLALACVGAAVATAAEPARAFVEILCSSERCYRNEPLRVVLRVGIDRDWFRAQAVQLFRQPLDLPVAVSAPWWTALAGAERLADPPAAPGRPTLRLVVNDAAIAAAARPEISIGGRLFTVVEVERRYLPTAPGTLLVAAPSLRFCYATSFEDDLFHGRVPKDRRDAYVEGEPCRVTVEPLPVEGVPGGFLGAIGRFEVRAEADRELVKEGETLRLTFHVQSSGDSNLETIPALRLDDLQGFHVYGQTESRAPGRLTATYEIAPTGSAFSAIPPIRWAYFDPAPPGRYAVATTPPIPLKVVTKEAPVAVRRRTSPYIAMLAGIAMAVALWWYGSRRRAHARERERQRGAHARWTAELAQADVNLAEAFADYLAAQLGCATAAVIGPDLASRLASAGLDPGLANETAVALESLVAARYGSGAAGSAGRAELARLADRIEGAFRSRAAAT